MIDLDKKELRKKIKELKGSYSLDQKKNKSVEIFKQIELHPSFVNSKIIMAYWSMDDEVHTHDFILKWLGEKRFVLPSVKGDELELREFTGLQEMIVGSAFTILEPKKLYKEGLDKIDLIIVPGVAFDRQNNRLGRGKAYYDKLLKNTTGFKIGVCFDFQMVDNVPVTPADIKMDLVITNP